MFLHGKGVFSVFMSANKPFFVVNATQKNNESVVGYICSFSPLAVIDIINQQICAISSDRSRVLCKGDRNWLFDAKNTAFVHIPFVNSTCHSIQISPCDQFVLLVFAFLQIDRIAIHCTNTGHLIRNLRVLASPVVVGWTKNSELQYCRYVDGRLKGFWYDISDYDREPRCVFESEVLKGKDYDVLWRDDAVAVLPIGDFKQPFSFYNKGALVASIHMPERARAHFLEDDDILMIANFPMTGAFLFSAKTGSMLHYVDLPSAHNIYCTSYFTSKNLLALTEPHVENGMIHVQSQRTMQAAADTLLELTILFCPALPPYVILHVYNCLVHSCAHSVFSSPQSWQHTTTTDLDAIADYKHGGKIRVIQKTIEKMDLLRRQSKKRGNK